MNNKSVRPEDILPNGLDSTTINGKIVRKGTIAAFIANIDILDGCTDTVQKEEATNALKELAPAVIAIGLHKHVTFKNSKVERILADAEIGAK